MFDLKKKWEKLWFAKLQKGKTKVELDRDREYETKWVWYHTVLAIELFICNVFLKEGMGANNNITFTCADKF